MSDSRFQPGALVRDNRSRVGRVVGGSGSMELDGDTVQLVAIDFWGEEQRRPEDWLTPLDADGPEALLMDRPQALAPWAEEAPLKLIALALSVDGGTGKVGDIREKLSGRVIEEQQWDNWWKKHSRSLGGVSSHIESVKAVKGNDYKLLTSVDAVPSSSTAPARSRPVPLKVWREWLLSGASDEVPGRFPTKPVVEALAKWDDSETIADVLIRLEVTAEGLRSKGDMTAQEAEHWLEAIGNAAIRRREIGGPDPRGYDPSRAGEALVRLTRIAGDRTPQDLLLQAGALDGEADAWRRGFAAGMWEAFDGEDAREMYLRSSAVLGRQARSDLARELFLAAFDAGFSERRHSELDRLLDALPDGERTQLLQEAIASAVSDRKEYVLGYVANSRHAEGNDQRDLRLLAALTLGDARSDFVAGVSREMADVLDQPQKYSKPVQAVFLEGSIKAEAARLNARAEVRNQQQTHDEQIEQERLEQERLRQQVRERNAELVANREESRLEVRQDMLLAVGEVLQSAYRRNDSGELAGDVKAGLALALRAGGAEPLETPGTLVEFDPELHDAKGGAPASGKVMVVAPGVIYRGGTHGDRVLLKAHVKHEAG